MSGVIGYIGHRDVKETVLTGLKRLEHLGYDSAGIGLVDDKQVHIFKEEGKLDRLEKALKGVQLKVTAGVGHTRWATHGQPSRINAHPHQSYTGRFVLVHKGLIENYQELVDIYIPNIKRESETDTEVIAHLIDHFSGQGMETEEAFRQVLGKLEGSFAIVLIDRLEPNRLYAAKNKSPLLIGRGEGENTVASAAVAMQHVTKTFQDLQDGEYAILDRNQVTIKKLDGQTVERDVFTLDKEANAVEMGDYDHYMLKEIDEQPAVIRQLINHYYDEKGELKLAPYLADLELPDRIFIVACGTSYHAGLVGKRYLEQIAQIPTEVHIASEFLYDDLLIDGKPLFIFISQSGETADSRGVLSRIKKRGYPTLTITNVEGSTLYREADFKLLTHAGPEIAIASTKAYTAQLVVLALFSIYLAAQKGLKSPVDPYKELDAVAWAMEKVLGEKERAKAIAHQFLAGKQSAFFIGRLKDYAVCLEGALKLKETSYIQAEGYASGELKHGPIALIEDGTPVFVLVTDERTAKITRSNAEEVRSRGGNTCLISIQGLHQPEDTWVLPKVPSFLTPLVAVLPFQMIAYYAALERGRDVDKPRHLTKSVMVE